MPVPCLAVPAEEHIVGSVEKQKMHVGPGPFHRIELFLGVGEEGATARVDHERDLVLASLAGDLERRRHERRREIVEHVVAEVL